VKPRSGGPRGARSEAKKRGDAPITTKLREPWESARGRAEKVIAFLESLPITKGILLGSRMKLIPDQLAFVRAVYNSDEGPARADQVLIAVKSEPRGNGKTGLVAGLALCHLVGPESERRGEIYSAASDRQQAAIIFEEMSAIIHAVPSFAARVNIQRFNKKMEVLSGAGIGSTFESLPAEAKRGHGLSPTLWIYDELAQAPDGELLNALKTGMGKRKRALGIVISTQAPEDTHPLSRLIDDGLSGIDPSILVHLTAAPRDADPFAEATIRAVNPALGIFLDAKTLFAEAEQAKRTPMWEAKFRNLRLNQRIDANTESRLAQAAEWREGEYPVDAAALEGRPCFGGLDLALKHDLAACVLAFPDDHEVPQYDLLAYFWTPEGQMAKRSPGEQEHFREWIRAGHLTLVPGPILQKGVIAQQLAALAQRYDVQVMAYDEWQLAAPAAEFPEVDLPWEKFKQQRTSLMAAAIRFVSECVRSGRLRHGGNPVLTASVLSADVVLDRAGNPTLDKSKPRIGVARIDGAVAMVMALGSAGRFVGEHVEGGAVFA
jgi:phage terminase large subunit-like protein